MESFSKRGEEISFISSPHVTTVRKNLCQNGSKIDLWDLRFGVLVDFRSKFHHLEGNDLCNTIGPLN